MPDNIIQNIDLAYPRNEGAVNCLEIELVDVRASDGLRILYDFDRDGWSIQQPDNEDNWREVSFHHSWALEV
jgi:hypothetical protein